MKQWWEQLKPQERRWAVVAGLFVFAMLNYFFVWPHFHEWGRNLARGEVALASNTVYRAEIRHKAEYQRLINELQAGGDTVLPEDQAIDFVHFFNSRAVSNKVLVTTQGQLVTHTNLYSLEQQMGISVQADETNLVNFLYSLGAGNSMMRVRAMSLHPDPSHEKLNASLTLVASYQKKMPARSAAPAAKTAATPSPKSPAPSPPRAAPAVKPTPNPRLLAQTNRPPLTNGPPTTNKLAGALARPVLSNHITPSSAKNQ